jgi:hypothetical protein
MKLMVHLKDRHYQNGNAKSNHYLIAANGAFFVKENIAFRAVIPVNLEEELGLQIQEELLEWKLPKIPFVKVQQAVNFFRAIKRIYGTEALMRVYFKPEDGSFILVVPEQHASSGYVVERGIPPAPEGCLLAMILHSHPGEAFHSSTDVRDEACLDGAHITVGDLEEPIPRFDVVITVKGRRYSRSPDEVMDYQFSVPEEWLGRVHQQVGILASIRRFLGGK